MKKRRPKQLTPFELEIMNVLWAIGPANVQTVREKLGASPQPAYTTVQTMLNILWRKGRVKRLLVGKAYQYEPAVSKQRAIRQVLHDLLDNVFGGSAETLVMTLIQNRQITPEKLDELRNMVKKAKDTQEPPDGEH